MPLEAYHNHHQWHSLATPGITAQQGVFTFYGTSEIDATPEEVWKIISHFSTYSSWNDYTPSITHEDGSDLTAAPEQGSSYTLHYRLDTKDKAKAMPMKLVSYSPTEHVLCWQGLFMPTFLLHAEKVQKVTPIQGENGKMKAKYEIWETQAGPMAHIVKFTMFSKLQRMNEGIAKNLKQHMEFQQQLWGQKPNFSALHKYAPFVEQDASKRKQWDDGRFP